MGKYLQETNRKHIGEFAQALAEAIERPARDILSISDVSDLLCCSVDTVRRIPHDELPVYRVGKSNLYLRDELIAFVRTRRVKTVDVTNLMAGFEDIDDEIQGVLDSPPVDVREPSRRRVK